MATSPCPRDGTPLIKSPNVFGPGTEAHSCPKCAGILVSWKVAQKFFETLGLSLADLSVAVQKASPVQRTNPPPPCTACNQGTMKPFNLKGVELDLCESCGSSWFDRGELQRLSGGKLGANVVASATPAPGERVETVGVFEMFWDCGYCDTKALLGKTNRFCPKCGAAQDAKSRYFPPEGQEVAANADFDGADAECPACQTPNGAKAVHCKQCGSPMDGSAKVATVADRVKQPPPGNTQPSAAKSKTWLYALAAFAALCCTVCGVAVLWTKEVKAKVSSHEWTREIDIESMRPKSDSSWCDSMPGDAYSVSRKQEQRSTKKIPDGETCSTRDVDRGNGTFERKKECKPKYREEPVYDSRCSYTVDRWQVERTAKAAGGLDDALRWPAINLGRTGSCIGCEREGPHHEKYTLFFKGPKGEKWDCSLNEARWRAISDGSEQKLKVGVLTNAASCDGL